MARLDVEQYPSVAPTGAPGDDYEHIESSPAAFGGAIARGEQTLGAGVEHAGEAGLDVLTARQQLQNEVHANEKLTWGAGQAMDKTEGFLQLEGKAASMALPQLHKDLGDIQTQMMNGESPAVKAMLSRSMATLFDRYKFYATEHAAGQERTWHDQVATDSAATFGKQAVLDAQHGTWDNVDQSLFKSDDEVTKLWEQRNGNAADPESKSVLTDQVAKNRGANVRAIVQTLAATDPRTAQAVFDRYKSSIDAASIVTISSQLKSLNADLDGRQIADEETGRAPRGGPPKPVAGVPASFVGAIKAEEGFDPKPRWDVKQWTVGYGTKASGPDERPNQAELEGRFQTSLTSAAKIVDSVNPNLDPGTKAALTSLTYNTGDAWTRAGLGDKIRAGDIAGAQKIFLSYANVAGQPNAAVAARRWREAQWFGQTEAPAGGPAPDKSQVYDRIVARTADNPLAQNAAVSRMNQIFSVERAETTQRDVLFQQRVKDTTAEAFSTGSVSQPLTENDFVQSRGFAQGRAEYADYQKDLALGADASAAASMSPADRDALYQRYTPVPGTTGYADDLKRQNQLGLELQRQAKARDSDPAGFAITRLADVKAAYQGMQQVEQDPKATDEQRRIARANYAAVAQREQSRIGIQPIDQRILSGDAANAFNGTLAGVAVSNDPQARVSLVARVQREAKLWGDNWPQVMRQLAPQAQPIVRAIGAGANPGAMMRLLSLDPKQDAPQKLLAGLETTTTPAKLTASVVSAMEPFKSTMVGSQVTSDYLPYQNLVVQLASLYVSQDKLAPDAAAAKAFNDVVGAQYDFRDTYRIPKSAGVSAAAVQAGAQAARAQLGAGTIAIKPAVDDLGLGADGIATDTRQNAARDGKWVTSPDNGGLNLAAPDGTFVRSPDGAPLKLSWAQLAALGAGEHRSQPSPGAGERREFLARHGVAGVAPQTVMPPGAAPTL
jgi:GH24 family phage-related lysozyme (muramidase)